MNKKNNRGFTLIELLAVIIILSSISLIVVSSITSSLSKREDKECEEQIAIAKNAAKIYFSLNDSATSVTITDLENGEYFSEHAVIGRLDKLSSVSINRSTGEITFNGTCK